MSISPRLRGGVYVDGFNMYHALDDLKKPYFKWLNLRRLAENFAKGHAHQIDRLAFCTAFFPGDFEKRKRHEAYNAAQEAHDVRIIMGHTTHEPMSCKECGRKWKQPREKETDINIALSAYHDVSMGLVDVVFLVTADTDQASTLRFLQQNHPRIKRVVVIPPGRDHKLLHLRDLADSVIKLREDHIDAAILPAIVSPQIGRIILRPMAYAPPIGWVHPDDRPR